MSVGRVSKYTSHAEKEEIKWQCGIYLRLSREDGDKMESDSISNQKKIIDRYLDKNPDIEISDIYIDDGFSGSNFERPSIIRLINDIKNRKVNCIIVKDLSRFGRNYYETGRYLEVVFPLLHVRFIAINDYIDSFKDPHSVENAYVSFKNVINDEYCRDISRKVRSSFDAKRRRGEYIGTYALYGYKKDPENRHRLIIDHEAAENVKLIYRLFLEGFSIYNIGVKLNQLGIPTPTEYRAQRGLNTINKLKFSHQVWCNATIKRILTCQMYIGNMEQGTYRKINHKVKKCVKIPKEQHVIVEGTHEPIIDKETFAAAQARFKRDSWQPKDTEPYKNGAETGSIFVGYMKCPDCGRAMQRTGSMQGKNSLYYFICASYNQWKICSMHKIRVKKLYAIVLKTVQTYIDIAVEAESILSYIESNSKDDFKLAEIKREFATCKLQLEKALKFQNDLYIDYKNNLLTRDQYCSFRDETIDKINALESLSKVLSDKLENPTCEKEEDKLVATFKKYHNITSLTRGAIEELIEMIYVGQDGVVTIEFKFRDEVKKLIESLKSVQDEYPDLQERISAVSQAIN